MIIWIAIISLILIGLALVVIELIFIPGTTVVGIIGVICVGFGLVLVFNNFGTTAGWTVTGVTGVFSLGVLIYAFRSGAWNKFALKQTIDSRVNEDIPIDLEIGDEGITRSALRPIGKGEFKDREYEVRSLGELVDSNTRIKVIKVDNRKIFVEPIN
ncbi:MAG: NfeD family protein [Bacteroidota bacterium]